MNSVFGSTGYVRRMIRDVMVKDKFSFVRIHQIILQNVPFTSYLYLVVPTGVLGLPQSIEIDWKPDRGNSIKPSLGLQEEQKQVTSSLAWSPRQLARACFLHGAMISVCRGLAGRVVEVVCPSFVLLSAGHPNAEHPAFAPDTVLAQVLQKQQKGLVLACVFYVFWSRVCLTAHAHNNL